jgi:hypothetical protein
VPQGALAFIGGVGKRCASASMGCSWRGYGSQTSFFEAVARRRLPKDVGLTVKSVVITEAAAVVEACNALRNFDFRWHQKRRVLARKATGLPLVCPVDAVGGGMGR